MRTKAGSFVLGVVLYVLTGLAVAVVQLVVLFIVPIPDWIGFGASAIIIALVTRVISRSLGESGPVVRISIPVAAYWAAGGIGALPVALFLGSNLGWAELHALSFGILQPSSTGFRLFGSAWSLAVPYGLIIVFAAAALLGARRHTRLSTPT